MDWYPWYFTLYEQDTMHLDPYQDGCYRRLIDHYMKTRSPLPDNDHALSRIVGDSYDNWMSRASEVVRPFFKAEKNGFLSHKRCDKELKYQDGKTKALSESGKKGAEARERNKNKISDLASHPKATLKPPLSHPQASAYAQDRTVQEDIIQPPVTNPAREEVKVQKLTAAQIGKWHPRTPAGWEKSKFPGFTFHRGLKPEQFPENYNPKDDPTNAAWDPSWFSGEIIKLRKSDYDAWMAMAGYDDEKFMEILSERDLWLKSQNPAIRKNWFVSTSKYLDPKTP